MSYWNPLNVDTKPCPNTACSKQHSIFRKNHHLGHLYAKRAINASLFLIAIISSVCLILVLSKATAFGLTKFQATLLTGGSTALFLTLALVYSACLGIAKCVRESRSKAADVRLGQGGEEEHIRDKMIRRFPKNAEFWKHVFPVNPDCPLHGDSQKGFAFQIPKE